MKKIITTLAGWYINVLSCIAPRKAAETGFMLFCRPFRVTVTDYHKKFLRTADQFSFDHDGIRIQAYRWGHGPKNILFLHGWQSHSFRWKAYIESLDKEKYSVYAFDAPGHGLSGGNFLNVPFYGSVMLQLIGTIGEIHTVIGHSLGSFSALYILHENPSLKIGRLLLMAPPGQAGDFIHFFRLTLGLSDKSMALINDHFTSVFKKPVTWFSTPKFAASVTIPGLIIHDEGDNEAPHYYAVEINKAWPKSTLLTTNGLGHNLKSPDMVNAVKDFIESEGQEIRSEEKLWKSIESY